MTTPAGGTGTTRRVVSSAVALAVRTLWERAATLVSTLLVARLLSPADFGQAAVVVAAGALAATVVDAGTTTWLVRAPGAPSRQQVEVARRVQLCLAALLTGAAATAALCGVELAALLLLACGKLPCRPLTFATRVRLQRALDFRGLALADAVGLLVQACAAVALATAVRGPAALVLADVLGGLATAAWVRRRLAAPADLAELPSGAGGSAPSWHAVLRAAVPFSGYALVASARDLGTGVVVGAVLGLRALGLLQFAYRLLSPVLVVFAAVGQLAVPLGRAVLDRDDRARTQVRDGFLVAGLLSAVVLSAVAAAAPSLVPVVFGDAWRPAVPAVLAVAFGLVVSGPLNALALGFLVADRRTGAASGLVAASALLFCGALVAFRPWGGVEAGAAAWVVMAVGEAVTVACACSRLLSLPLARPSAVGPACFTAAYACGAAVDRAVQGAVTGGVAAGLVAAAVAALLTWLVAGRVLLALAGAVRGRPEPLLEVAA